MSRTTRTALLRYGGALAFTALAAVLRRLLDPWLGNDQPFVRLFAAVTATVWLGGYRPAILATVLGFLACDWLFVEPHGSLEMANGRDFVGLFAYLLSCGVVIGFGEALRASRRRADRERNSLRRTHDILKLVHQIGKIGHWEWDSLTDENRWSPEIEALYGLAPGTRHWVAHPYERSGRHHIEASGAGTARVRSPAEPLSIHRRGRKGGIYAPA